MKESFWDFSVRTYGTEQVPEACLLLQDEQGVDVNMLLFCSWFGATRGRMNEKQFGQFFDFSEEWAVHVVRPLRGVRSWMKQTGCHDPHVAMGECMDYREKVKGVEITGEKMQQDVLESMTSGIEIAGQSAGEQLESAIANLKLYFLKINVSKDRQVSDRLLVILKAAFVDRGEEEIMGKLNLL